MRLTILCLAFLVNIPLGSQISMEQKRALQLREPTSQINSTKADSQTAYLGILIDHIMLSAM